ncbi:Signal transduction histidine kinase [Actinomyces ruminicola]|uniref:histidine kinase n=1 Tax=Actinomyces ruminicola TaxID=332524 RepID=A0A1H0AL09_9ACTO|nr:histidine kinase [Actinomyces ruminicola]SDN34089.1 Signal transduction histidine kinase [Actinomyces ruminicola]
MAELSDALASLTARARKTLLRPPEPLSRRRVYVIIGAIVGLGNLVGNVVVNREALKPIDLAFMVATLVLVTLIPLRPVPSVMAYLACWVLLLLIPSADFADMTITNLAFLFFLGRFFPPWPAFSMLLTTLLIEAVLLMSLSSPGNEIANSLGTLWYMALMGALLVPLGALVRFIEASRLADAEQADAQLEEMRLEIAREMHDLVAYSMSQTALRAQRAAADTSYPDRARDEFTALEATASDALHELRLLLRTLRRPSSEQEQSVSTTTGLGNAVTDLTIAVGAVSADVSSAGFDITYRHLGEVVPTRIQASTLSRVAREMGANIIRHGDPHASVTMTLSLGPEVIRLVSTNRVRDTSAHLPRSGTGILGMRERLAAIGGTLTTLSDNGSWMVTATVPVAESRPILLTTEKNS